MKNVLKIALLLVLVCATIFTMIGCEKKEEPAKESGEATVVTPVESGEEEVNVPKNEQIGTAGSNMPLKDRADDAKQEIEKAFQAWIAETYGEKVVESKVYVEKMYTAEEEQEVEAIKEMNLGAEEIAFEVRYELKPAEGADINELTVANGVYDEESGWIKEKFNLGVLRPSIEGEALYRVTNIGTGW